MMRDVYKRQVHILIVGADAVDNAVVGDLDDPVGNSLRELMVMAGEDDLSLIHI